MINQQVSRVDEIEKIIINVIIKNTDIDLTLVNAETKFSDLSLDSLRVMLIVSDLEKSLNLKMGATINHQLLFEYPTIYSFAEHLSTLEVSDE